MAHLAPDIRRGIEREADRAKRTISKEIEHRLRESLKKPAKSKKELGDNKNRALAGLLVRAARGIELVTDGKRWDSDAFAADALRAAFAVILGRLAPNAPVETPQRVKESLRWASPEQAAMFSTPEGVGTSIGRGILDALEIYEYPPLDHARNVHYANDFYEIPQIREHLGIAKGKNKS
jgi:hypothetical protein